MSEAPLCDCGAPSEFLCDQPMKLAQGERLGPGAPAPTCSAPLCAGCRSLEGATFLCGEAGFVDSVDLCPVHARSRIKAL